MEMFVCFITDVDKRTDEHTCRCAIGSSNMSYKDSLQPQEITEAEMLEAYEACMNYSATGERVYSTTKSA